MGNSNAKQDSTVTGFHDSTQCRYHEHSRYVVQHKVTCMTYGYGYIAFCQGYKMLVLVGEGNKTSCLNIERLTFNKQHILISPPIICIRFLSATEILIVGQSQLVVISNMKEVSYIYHVPNGEEITCMDINNKQLVIGCESGAVFIMDMVSREWIFMDTVSFYPSRIECILIQPNSQVLIAHDTDKLCSFDTDHKKIIHTFDIGLADKHDNTHGHKITCIYIYEQIIYAAFRHGLIIMWNITPGVLVDVPINAFSISCMIETMTMNNYINSFEIACMRDMIPISKIQWKNNSLYVMGGYIYKKEWNILNRIFFSNDNNHQIIKILSCLSLQTDEAQNMRCEVMKPHNLQKYTNNTFVFVNDNDENEKDTIVTVGTTGNLIMRVINEQGEQQGEQQEEINLSDWSGGYIGAVKRYTGSDFADDYLYRLITHLQLCYNNENKNENDNNLEKKQSNTQQHIFSQIPIEWRFASRAYGHKQSRFAHCPATDLSSMVFISHGLSVYIYSLHVVPTSHTSPFDDSKNVDLRSENTQQNQFQFIVKLDLQETVNRLHREKRTFSSGNAAKIDLQQTELVSHVLLCFKDGYNNMNNHNHNHNHNSKIEPYLVIGTNCGHVFLFQVNMESNNMNDCIIFRRYFTSDAAISCLVSSPGTVCVDDNNDIKQKQSSSLIAVANYRGGIQIRDLTTGKIILRKKITSNLVYVTDIVFSNRSDPQKNRESYSTLLYCGLSDGSVIVFALPLQTVIASFSVAVMMYAALPMKAITKADTAERVTSDPSVVYMELVDKNGIPIVTKTDPLRCHSINQPMQYLLVCTQYAIGLFHSARSTNQSLVTYYHWTHTAPLIYAKMVLVQETKEFLMSSSSSSNTSSDNSEDNKQHNNNVWALMTVSQHGLISIFDVKTLELIYQRRSKSNDKIKLSHDTICIDILGRLTYLDRQVECIIHAAVFDHSYYIPAPLVRPILYTKEEKSEKSIVIRAAVQGDFNTFHDEFSPPPISTT